MEIVFEDSQVLVCRKEAGLAVQSGRVGAPDLVSMLKNRLWEREGKEPYLGVVHRLDQPVEGILLVAKNRDAAADLSRQAADHTRMEKWYRALVCGKLPEKEGMLVDYLTEDARENRSGICPPDTPGAKECRLSYRVLEEGGGWSLVEIRLLTGRRHQIRVQMAHAGAPVMGDRKYGKADPGSRGLALCSFRLTFCHPRTGEPLSFQVEPTFPVPPTAP